MVTEEGSALDTLIQRVLNAPIDEWSVPKEVTTVRQYLYQLLKKVWVEGEMFDGKRPFGNSSWQHFDIYKALVVAGIIQGTLDEDGYLDDISDEEIEHANMLMNYTIAHIFSQRYTPPLPRGEDAVISTMCFCGDNRVTGRDGQFIPHLNERTGNMCPPPGARLS